VGTGELFTVDFGVLAPVEAKSGTKLEDGSPGGVKAHVFSCASCDDADARFVGYLSRSNAEQLADPRGVSAYRDSRTLLAKPNPDNPSAIKWSPYDQAINKIIPELQKQCSGQSPTICNPH
jgi:hypothetical protein